MSGEIIDWHSSKPVFAEPGLAKKIMSDMGTNFIS